MEYKLLEKNDLEFMEEVLIDDNMVFDIDYRQAKKQMQEYGVVKKNVDSILYPSQSKAKEQERG